MKKSKYLLASMLPLLSSMMFFSPASSAKEVRPNGDHKFRFCEDGCKTQETSRISIKVQFKVKDDGVRAERVTMECKASNGNISQHKFRRNLNNDEYINFYITPSVCSEYRLKVNVAAKEIIYGVGNWKSCNSGNDWDADWVNLSNGITDWSHHYNIYKTNNYESTQCTHVGKEVLISGITI